MKIYFYCGLGQGGAERQVYESSILMKNVGYDVKVITYDKTRVFYQLPDDIELIDIKGRQSFGSSFDKLLALYRLYVLILRQKPDYVLSYITKINASLGLIGLMPSIKKNTKLIGSERTDNLRYMRSLMWKALCKIAYRGLNALTANNRQALIAAKELLTFEEANLFYLPNLLRTDKFVRQHVDTFENVDKDKINILVPGRICEEKNQKSLLKIVDMIKQSPIDARFILAGNDETDYAKTMKTEILKGKQEEHFVFLGQVEDMINLYNFADIMYLPSLYEGMPNVMLEALSCGSICVISNKCSGSEVIMNGVNGYLVDVEDSSVCWLTIVEALYLDDMKKERLRIRARETAESFGPSEYIKKIEMLLNAIAVCS